GGIGLVAGGQLARCDFQAGVLDDLPGDPLVVTPAHRYGRGEFGERLAGNDPATTVDEPHLAPLGIDDVHGDAPAARLVGDDPGVRVEIGDVLLGFRDEQRLVDDVLPLDREDGHPAEAQLLVEADGRIVVVHDRQIEMIPSAADIALAEYSDQRLADTGYRRLRVDGQAP